MPTVANPTWLGLTALQHGAARPAAASGDLPGRVQEAAILLKALANPDRLMLLCRLVQGERTVTELGVLSGLTQPTLSQQLSVLRGERLVSTRRDGKNVIYCVSSAAALAILQTLYILYRDVAAPMPSIPADGIVARHAQKDPA